jgi:type IV pilus assembly protein PilC
LLKFWGKRDSGRLFYDRLYLKLPVIGTAISRIAVARFARTMGTLVQSGIPVLQALEIVEEVVGNAVISRAVGSARASIREGESLALPLAQSGVFEPMVTQMIAVGEETGALDEMLVKMSDYFEREVIYMVDNIMAIIEPLLIIIVALLVGGIVIATLLPIFSIVNAVG